MANKLPMNFDILMKLQTSLGDGGKAPVKVDLSSGDWTPPAGFAVSRLTCTGGNTIIIDWSDGENLVTELSLPAESILPVFNIVKIRQSGTDATNIVAWPLVL